MQKIVRERILALDLLRGYFLFVIVIDHLFRFPSLFEVVTGRGQLWVSAAEGFFIISGLLIGFIYKNQVVSTPHTVFIKIWKRAGKLYLLSVFLTILFTIWGWLLNSPDVKLGIWPYGLNPWLMFSKIISLQYVYGWADFLPFYAVFMFFAPVALWLIAKKNVLAVVVLSTIMWIGRGNNFYLAWQTLFVAGIVIGFYFSRIENYFISLQKQTRKILLVGLFSTTLASLLVSVFFVFGVWTIFRASWVGLLPQNVLTLLAQAKDWYFPIQTAWFDKNTLPPIRIFLSGLWFSALLVLFRMYEERLASFLGGILMRFGQNSLLVYVIHGFILFPSFLFLPGDTDFLVNSLIDLSVVGMVYAVVVWHKQFLDVLSRVILEILVTVGILKLQVLEDDSQED